MIYDLIIIGGGPAGVTAGIYAGRQGLKALLITKSFGGQMGLKTVEIENYPGFEHISGLDLVKKFEQHLRQQKIEALADEVGKVVKSKEGFLVSCENKGQFRARAVIIASGADPRPLEAPGEKEFIGRGVSYCTVCDGPMFAAKRVAVVGGGNSGFEAAIFLSRIAKKVYILEAAPKVAASQANQQIAKKSSKIEVITSAGLKEIKGKKFVEEVVYEDTGVKKSHILKVEGIFVEIGSVPATGFVKGLVVFNKKDEIKIDPRTCATKTPGLFAAGDVTDMKVKQIIVAAGQGCQAVFGAYNYINKKSVQSVRGIF